VINITLIDAIKMKFKANKEETELKASRPVGSTTECGTSYHRHSDKYHGKCHPIKLKHRKKGDAPHKTNPAKQKTPLKTLKVKES